MQIHNNRRALRALLLVAFASCAALTRSALAGPLPANDEVPEMMMEMQATYAAWLAYTHGTPPETLHFTSNTNITARSFTFTMNAGQTYGGQSATLLASGSFNSAANKWNFAASGSVGASNWSSSGFSQDPPFNWYYEHDW